MTDFLNRTEEKIFGLKIFGKSIAEATRITRQEIQASKGFMELEALRITNQGQAGWNSLNHPRFGYLDY